MKPNQFKIRLERSLLEVVSFYRGLVLDMVEHEVSGRETWPATRSRLLKALGDRGLAGRIQEVLNTEFSSGGAE
jgi:hypothetical protein